MNKRKAIAIKRSVIEKMYGEGEHTKEESRQLLYRSAKKWATKGRTNNPVPAISKRQKRLLTQKQKEDVNVS